MKQGLLMNFPEGFEPRGRQAETLKKIEKAVDNGKKFIIVNAPTGSGKSLLSKTFGNISNDVPKSFERKVDDYSIFSDDGPDLMDEEKSFGCYALTITKALQDQYHETFDDTSLLKGKANYQCDVDDELTVDVAPCLYVKGLKQECWNANRCPYYNQRNEMLKSQFSTLSYSMFFSLPEHLKRRELMVCDEGSELEEQLVNQFTCEVDTKFLMKTGVITSAFPSSEKSSLVLEWINKLVIELDKTLEEYKKWFSNSSNKKDQIEFSKKKSEWSKLSNLYQKVGTLSKTFYDSQYIIEREDSSITFTPLKVNVLSKYLFDHVDHVLILSATIIDPSNYCKSLGIENYEYIEVPSDFQSENAPIYMMPKQKLNYSNLKGMLPKLVKQVEGILEHHENEKGIIHTHTQYIADFIKNNIKSDRLLVRDREHKNENLLEEHFSTNEPTVLVSPSMTFGVDLYDDYGRFQILMKAPWLPTKDKRVAQLMKIDKNWYANQMLKTLVQSCGRCVRSKTDKCDTYILDGSIYDGVVRNKQKLPKFFLERFQ